MLKELRHRLLLAAAICLLILASPLVAAEGINDHPVSVDWFGNHLKDAEVLIFDISPAQPMYEGQQISGVVNVDLFSYGGREVPGPPRWSSASPWHLTLLIATDPVGFRFRGN